MNERLEKYLYKKYPDLFVDHDKPMTETCMCWGCSCGDGWLLLLDKLCWQISSHIRSKNESIEWYEKSEAERVKKGEPPGEKPPWITERITKFRFDQVKEKFGALRIYSSGGDEEIRAMIGFAETLSRYICEECGKFDTTVGSTTKGWIHSICFSCAYAKDVNFKRSTGWKMFETNKQAYKLSEKVKADNIKNKGKEIAVAMKKLAKIRKNKKK
jgi:hypothetical protein